MKSEARDYYVPFKGINVPFESTLKFFIFLSKLYLSTGVQKKSS